MKRKISISLLIAGIYAHAGLFDAIMQKAPSLGSTPSAQTSAQTDNALISTLTRSLGVTPKQAGGGTAALMTAAAQSMPRSNYSQLLKSVPGLSSVVNGNEALVSGAANMLGGTDIVGSTFKMLGMDNSMIAKFAPALLDYIKPYATPENLALLKQAWNAFL